ncbi:hypothetical protein, partial [Erythrobacter sp. YJ-T3-07]|uniref:hypothetical protein n=1 Tax=Erythrobacter sp. YJ-T3-07 TaxID=2793063 RepID=UPI001F48530B
MAALQQDLRDRQDSEVHPNINPGSQATAVNANSQLALAADAGSQDASQFNSAEKHVTTVEQLVSQTLANLAVSR